MMDTSDSLARAHRTRLPGPRGVLRRAWASSRPLTFGVEDGGPGLPVTAWSTTGGDLRVPHFVGLHALQALPLLGILLARFDPSWLRPGHRKALVWTTAISYLGLVVLLTWQALRGQPLLEPDAATLGALLAVAAVAGTTASAVMLHAHRTIQKERSS